MSFEYRCTLHDFVKAFRHKIVGVQLVKRFEDPERGQYIIINLLDSNGGKHQVSATASIIKDIMDRYVKEYNGHLVWTGDKLENILL